MKSGEGQQYINNLFRQGLVTDLNTSLPTEEVRSYYTENNFFSLFHESINTLKAGQGIVDIAGGVTNASLTFLGSIYYDAHIYHFWSKTSVVYIYRDYDLIGQHANYPGATGVPLYMDIDNNTGEIAITDNVVVPIVLNLDDMYDKRLTTTYQADYDKDLYEINSKIELTAPKFAGLNNVSTGGGLRPGSYSYSYRLVNNLGDKSPWSPPTPFIPVPVSYGQVAGLATYVNPGAKWYGSEAKLNPTRYGIDISMRVNNFSGFDYMEIRRQANNAGTPVDYTASAEVFQLDVDISSTYNIVNFTDSVGVQWAPLDESIDAYTSYIEKCRTLRFYNGRLVLGDVTYVSKIINDTSIFKDIVTGKQGIPFKKGLRYNGYYDMDAQVYLKSLKLGERYSWGVRVHDNSGNRAFVIPVPDLTNYKLPERREKILVSEQGYYQPGLGPGLPDMAPIDSNQDTYTLDKTYDVFRQQYVTKSSFINSPLNIVEGAADYNPFTPTNRAGGYKGFDYSGYRSNTTTNIGDTALTYLPGIFGHEIQATGMKLGGINRSSLPDWVAGFSYVRTEAAGRVVAQGLGMYALAEGTVGTTATKALNKLWTYFPELDSVVGDKAGLYEDIKANPGDYQIQLVAPYGFTTEVYNCLETSVGTRGKVDMVSYANFYWNKDGDIIPYDADTDIGEGNGHITFGKWRNPIAVGTGVSGETSPYEYIFDILAAEDVDIGGKNGRTQYLDLTLGSNIYAEEDFTGLSMDTASVRNAHEPWYIINIIKNGAVVGDNSATLFKEIGHHIQLDSTIGEGTGKTSQVFKTVSERLGDFKSSSYSTADSSTYRYVWVDGQRWMCITDITPADVITLKGYTATQYNSGVSFGGITIYGIYEVQESTSGVGYDVVFNTQSTVDTSYIVPGVRDKIVIRYDENEPIDLFLGDTIIAETGFTPIDCLTTEWDGASAAAQQAEHFRLNCAMPFGDFTLSSQIYQPDDVASTTDANRYQAGTSGLRLDFIRQWMVNFICESSINIPMLYKDFWPHVNYVMRPNIYDTKTDDETVEAYLERLNIYKAYNTDYPDEYLTWGYGGFKTPQGYNFDYNKFHSDRYASLNEAGINEVLHYPKRLHWSTAKPASLSQLEESFKLFLPTNVYDLRNEKATQISILYDAYSNKGDNLYAITDKGVAMLITNEALLRDGVGDNLGIILSDAGFISNELWISKTAGSDGTLFRGRAEGSIVTRNNVEAPILVFASHNKLYMLSGTSLIDLITNNRKDIKGYLEALASTDPLSMAINSKTNSLMVLIKDRLLNYSFDIENWDRNQLLETTEVKSVVAADTLGSDRDRIAFINYDGGIKLKKTSDSVVTQMLTIAPKVITVVTPGLDIYEFVDLFIKASQKPSSIVFTEIGRNNTLTITTSDAGFKSLEDGQYYVRIGRGSLGKFISQQLRIQINFNIADLNSDSYVSYIKTGIREINN